MVGDEWFRPARLVAKVGQTLTWRFSGSEPHSVTVANGPRGFSSFYAGNTTGEFKFTPTVKGTYRLTCLIHPTTMGQTVVVK
jgi:plastocyanin